MKLLRRGSDKQQAAEDVEQQEAADAAAESEQEEPGPHLLNDGPLFARWFILYELEKEMRRASRHERPLSVMVLTPVATLGAQPSEQALNFAAEAARRSSRATDLIGWLPSGGILIIMPETDRDGASAAVYRWKNEMYTSTVRHGAVRWQVATNFNASEFENAQTLLDAVCADLKPAEAA